jgi:hypothetical protein
MKVSGSSRLAPSLLYLLRREATLDSSSPKSRSVRPAPYASSALIETRDLNQRGAHARHQVASMLSYPFELWNVWFWTAGTPVEACRRQRRSLLRVQIPGPQPTILAICRAEPHKAVRLLPVCSPTLAAATVDSGPRSALLQDGNRIDGRCTPGGHIAGDGARRSQQPEHTEPDDRVARADAEQQARERPRQDG